MIDPSAEPLHQREDSPAPGFPEDLSPTSPGSVFAEECSGLLYIADTSAHRILIAELATGELLTCIGSGKCGCEDGDFENAEFNLPGGMAPVGNRVYVADSGNHAVRLIDLETRTVSTVVSGIRHHIPGFRFPYAIRSLTGRMIVAMRASGHLWELDPEFCLTRVYVGTGRSGRQQEEWFHQVSLDGKLYVTDTDGNRIAAVQSAPAGMVTVFGDGSPELLDRPGGISAAGGFLYIADTGNHRILKGDPRTGRLTTVPITRPAGHEYRPPYAGDRPHPHYGSSSISLSFT